MPAFHCLPFGQCNTANLKDLTVFCHQASISYFCRLSSTFAEDLPNEVLLNGQKLDLDA